EEGRFEVIAWKRGRHARVPVDEPLGRLVADQHVIKLSESGWCDREEKSGFSDYSGTIPFDCLGSPEWMHGSPSFAEGGTTLPPGQCRWADRAGCCRGSLWRNNCLIPSMRRVIR